LGWIAQLETRGSIAMDMRPVQHGGGQALAADTTLYDEMRGTSEGELWRQAPNLLDND
jgi:hypothetical protein